MKRSETRTTISVELEKPKGVHVYQSAFDPNKLTISCTHEDPDKAEMKLILLARNVTDAIMGNER